MDVSIEAQSDKIVELVASLQIDADNLSDKQAVQIEKMRTKLVEFDEQYATHSQLSVAEFAAYLNHDALSPLTVVMGYAELFRTVLQSSLTEIQFVIIVDICNQIRQLTESLRALRDEMVAKRNAMAS